MDKGSGSIDDAWEDNVIIKFADEERNLNNKVRKGQEEPLVQYKNIIPLDLEIPDIHALKPLANKSNMSIRSIKDNNEKPRQVP